MVTFIHATESQINARKLETIAESRGMIPQLIQKMWEKEGGELRISYDQHMRDRVHFDINLWYKNVSKVVGELLAWLPSLSDTEVTEVHCLLTNSPVSDQEQIRKHIVYRLAEIFWGKSN
jgi:EAL domain-containing protein (putative c-di-GMP-specific phosphodiesterase class I)